MPAYLDHLAHPQDHGLPADADAGRPDLLVTWFHGSDPQPLQEQDEKPSRP
jgi:hypothetical protein